MASARVRAAFISLKRFDLHRARELLVRGRADPREVICLYPRLLPASSNFTRSVRALNDIADVNQIAKHDAQKLSALDTFLVDYLEYIRAAEGEQFVHKHVRHFSLCVLVQTKLLRKSINSPYHFERLIGKFLLRLDKDDTDIWTLSISK